MIELRMCSLTHIIGFFMSDLVPGDDVYGSRTFRAGDSDTVVIAGAVQPTDAGEQSGVYMLLALTTPRWRVLHYPSASQMGDVVRKIDSDTLRKL